MNSMFRIYQLAARGERGLGCDERGLSVGPIQLVSRDQSNVSQYRCASEAILKRVAGAIFGIDDAERGEWFRSRVATIAEAMSNGQHAVARIAAVQLRLPPISRETERRLRKIASGLAKFNPSWGAEPPRDRNGRWTTNGEGPIIPVIAPYTPECLEAINAALRICIERYTAAGGGLGPNWMTRCVRGYVPIDCGY